MTTRAHAAARSPRPSNNETATKIVAILAIAGAVLTAPRLVAAPAAGRTTASASARVTITIPKLTGIDVSIPAATPAATRGSRVTVRLFHTATAAIVLRTAPSDSNASGIHRVALREPQATRTIAGSVPGGWHSFDDVPPTGTPQRTSGTAEPREVTYEIWTF